MRKNGLLLIVLLLALVLSACQGLQIQRSEDGGADVTVTLDAERIRERLDQIVSVGNNPDGLMGSITVVNLVPADNIMRISGELQTANGQTITGSIDIQFSVQDGGLLVQIVAMQAAGFNMPEDRQQRLNDALAAGFGSAASATENVSFVSATVTDTTLELVFHVQRQSGS
jgi:hypothetical protein